MYKKPHEGSLQSVGFINCFAILFVNFTDLEWHSSCIKKCMKMFYIICGILFVHLTISSSAYPCGFCQGDKAASVYSFKNKKLAERTSNVYIAVEIVGYTQSDQTFYLKKTLLSLDCVIKNTVRLSPQNSAGSFVYDQSCSLEKIEKDFAEKTQGKYQLKSLKDR